MPPVRVQNAEPPLPSTVPVPVPAATRRTGFVFLGLGLLVLVAMGIVWRVEPSGQPYFPRCLLHQWTGLQCPGCGATRALHALLNGRVVEAFRHNALVLFVVPLGAALGVRWVRGRWTGSWWPNPLTQPWLLALLAGLAAGFGVGRNLG